MLRGALPHRIARGNTGTAGARGPTATPTGLRGGSAELRSHQNTEPDSSVKVLGHRRAARQRGRRGSHGQRRSGRADAHRPAPAHRLVRGTGPLKRRRGAKESATPGRGEGCPGSRSYLPPPDAGAPAAISYLPLRLPIGPPRHTLGPAPLPLRHAIGCGRHLPATIGRFERATADPRARGGGCWGNGHPCGAGLAGSCRRRRRTPPHREPRACRGRTKCSKEHELHHKLQFSSWLESLGFLSLLSIKDK